MGAQKVAIITGGQRGIGLDIAQRFARDGFCVVIADITDASKEAELIVSSGGVATSIVTDISDENQVRALFDQVIERFGRIDVLINNAVLFQKGTVTDHSWEIWDKLMGTNLKGAFLCSRYAVMQMRRNGGGSILNLGSEYGIKGGPARAIYATAKADLHHMTKLMAVDHTKDGVRVNCLVPGPIMPPMLKLQNPDRAEALEKETDSTILKQLGTLDEISGVAAFLVSDAASFMTGAVVTVDGGVSVI